MCVQGFWDAYRSTYSLLALWQPARMAEMMEGWLSQWRESGWIPQWAAPVSTSSSPHLHSCRTSAAATLT